MSWLYSQALVEDYSQATYSAGGLSAPSNGTTTPQAYCSHASETDSCRTSRYGVTCARLPDDHGEALLTWYREASRAKRSAPQLEGALLPRICGRRCSASLTKSSQCTCPPRMSRSAPSNKPRAILNVSGTELRFAGFPRKTWVQTTCGNDIGFVHTPTTKANYAATSMQKWPSARSFVRAFGRPSPMIHEWLMGWPIGWSDTSPLETDRFRAWLQQHGDY